VHGYEVVWHKCSRQKRMGKRPLSSAHMRFEVRGSRFEVRGSRFEVRGSRFEKISHSCFSCASFFLAPRSFFLGPRFYLLQQGLNLRLLHDVALLRQNRRQNPVGRQRIGQYDAQDGQFFTIAGNAQPCAGDKGFPRFPLMFLQHGQCAAVCGRQRFSPLPADVSAAAG